MSYRVVQEQFSGPFDLLLRLVQKQRMDVSHISLENITQQYLSQIEELGEVDLDVASDFALVAATLLALKSNRILPAEYEVASTFDDEEDMSEGNFSSLSILIARLCIYKQYRQASVFLAEKEEAAFKRYAAPSHIAPELENFQTNYLEGITLRTFAVTAADVFARSEQALLEANHIAPKRISLKSVVQHLRNELAKTDTTTFDALLFGDFSSPSVVQTLLAILQLERDGCVTTHQHIPFSTIEVKTHFTAHDTDDLPPTSEKRDGK